MQKKYVNEKYEGNYSIYNYPSWKEILRDNWAITIKEKRDEEFFALVDSYNSLCGYIRLVNNKDYIIVGLGLIPRLCGQGIGKIVMRMMKDICIKIYPNQKIILEVRFFNKRAIRCYEKAGFKIVERFEKHINNEKINFVKMEFNY